MLKKEKAIPPLRWLFAIWRLYAFGLTGFPSIRFENARVMKDLDEKIPEEMAAEVLALAARLYSEQNLAHSMAELIEPGADEKKIPQIYIRQAYRQIMFAKGSDRQPQKKLQEWQKKLLVMLSCLGGVGVFWTMGLYLSLSWGAQEVDSAWVQVEKQGSVSASLIPNLASLAKVYAKQQTEIVVGLEQSRQKYLQANAIGEKEAAIAELSGAIEAFNNYAASNAQLRSNLAFLNLQSEIADTQQNMARSQQLYKQAIESYNQQIQSFPNFLIAPIFGFKTKPLSATQTK